MLTSSDTGRESRSYQAMASSLTTLWGTRRGSLSHVVANKMHLSSGQEVFEALNAGPRARRCTSRYERAAYRLLKNM